MEIQPMYTQVLVRLMEATNKSAGGIELVGKPDETIRARVVAVGHGRRGKDGVIIPLMVKENDVVLIEDGRLITVDGEQFYMLKEDEILAILG